MKTKLFVLAFVMSGLLLMGQSITVTSPDGGESWVFGSSQNITWTTAGITTGTYKITLWKSGSNLGTVATNLPASQHSFPWTVGNLDGAPPVSTGPGYTIKVKLQGEAASDFSNGPFSITSGPVDVRTITVTDPNGGESWKLGDLHDITWTHHGFTTGTYKITLWKGSTDMGTIAKDLPAAQELYCWTVGNVGSGTVPASSGYKVKVKLQGEPVADDSNGTFRISTGIHIEPGWLEKIKQAQRIRIPWWIDPPGPDPWCPQCVGFPLDKIKELIQNVKDPVQVGLLQNGKLLGVLGKFQDSQFLPGRGNRLLGTNRLMVNLGPQGQALMKDGQGILLQMTNLKTGKIIGNFALQLNQLKIKDSPQLIR